MCRLAYIQNPKALIQKVGKEKVLSWLNHLEQVNGGHGNGLGGLVKTEKGEELYVEKGVHLENGEILEILESQNWVNGAIYHTRLASSGGISDHLCHPHKDLYGILILAHNGHILGADDLLKILKLFDDRYKKYHMSYYSRYRGCYWEGYRYVCTTKYDDDKVDDTIVSDTWVLTNLVSLLLRKSGMSEMKVMAKIYINILNHDAVIIQTIQGNSYLLIDREDFEFVIDPEAGVVAGSQSLDMLGYDKVYKGYGVVMIPRNGKPKLYGKFRIKKKRKKITKKKVPTTYYDPYIDTDKYVKLWNECMYRCAGDPDVAIKKCDEICEIVVSVSENEEDIRRQYENLKKEHPELFY